MDDSQNNFAECKTREASDGYDLDYGISPEPVTVTRGMRVSQWTTPALFDFPVDGKKEVGEPLQSCLE